MVFGNGLLSRIFLKFFEHSKGQIRKNHLTAPDYNFSHLILLQKSHQCEIAGLFNPYGNTQHVTAGNRKKEGSSLVASH